MTPADVLRAARERLSDFDAWAQGDMAFHINPRHGVAVSVPPESPEAVCWCALGGIQREALNAIGVYRVEHDAVDYLAYAIDKHQNGGRHVGHYERNDDRVAVVYEYNDDESTTHADILARFDESIELAERKYLDSDEYWGDY